MCDYIMGALGCIVLPEEECKRDTRGHHVLANRH